MQAAPVIQGALISQELRNITEKVGNNTAAALDIDAANISLVEKEVLHGVRLGTATRESVTASPIEPAMKAMILASPVGLTLSQVSATGAVGDVTGDGVPE